jgi:hypothetical protein
VGRHAAEVPSLADQISKKLGVARPKHRTKPARVLIKPNLIPVWGFVFVVGWILVTVVDPYSGTLTSAQASMLEIATNENQDLSISNSQTISFARGGYEVITGKSANKLFVQLAQAPDVGTSQAYAFDYIQRFNWGFDQYSCLVTLWNRESNWRINASNAQSGAYGIPQALPGTKMASEGMDWLTNPETQIRWGAKYIKARYGSACGALVHSNNFGWY